MLGVAEARQVNRDQVCVCLEPRPSRLESEQALRPGAEEEGMRISLRILALGEPDG